MADYSDYKECTDCAHYELCLYQEKFLIEHNRKDLIRRYGFGLCEPENCCHFKDRSRFVELPAKIVERYYIDIDQAKTVSDMLLIISQNFEYNGDSSSTFKSYFIGVGDAIESCLKVLTPFWKEQEKDG